MRAGGLGIDAGTLEDGPPRPRALKLRNDECADQPAAARSPSVNLSRVPENRRPLAGTLKVGHDQPNEMLAADRAPRGRSLPFDAIKGNKAGIPTGGALL